MSLFLSEIFNGLSVSSILLLIALGLAITFGLMKVINMAHGELMMIGAYVTYVVQGLFKLLPTSVFDSYFVFALFAAFIIAGLFGWVLEVLLVRFLYGRSIDSLLATWGVSLILQQLARNIFGAPNVAVIAPSWLSGGIQVAAGLNLPYSRIFIFVLACICLLGMYLYLFHTSIGRKTRAVMQNREMAACLGISTRKIDSLTFSIGAGIAGIAGCALTLLGPIGPSIGTFYIVDAFMTVVLGGVGTLPGSLAGAIGIGIPKTALEFLTTVSLAKVFVFLAVIAVLQWRPAGFFAVRSRSLD